MNQCYSRHISHSRSPCRVGVLAYDGCIGTAVFGIVDLLHIANQLAYAVNGVDGDSFRVTVVARKGAQITTAGGVTLRAQRWTKDFDALVVPSFDLRTSRHLDRTLNQWQPELAYIASAAATGMPVHSVCVGAFLLGEAGLLEGRRATTSWLFAEALQQRYKGAIVDADLMICSDGPITTTAAFSAVHDLALRIIRTHAGDDIARGVARVLLVADNRNSQAPYVDTGLLEPGTDTFIPPVKQWLVERLDQNYDLATLARSFHVSTRTMLRRFRDQTGQSPLDFLQQARVDTAKRLLESPEHTVTSAMQQVGYSDPTSFRQLFASRVGMTPAAYRHQFLANGHREGPDVKVGSHRRPW